MTDSRGEKTARWTNEVLKPFLQQQPEREAEFLTDSGIPVKPLYTPADVADLDYDRDLGYPGEYPFTRGIYPSMYRGRFWTMRQISGLGTSELTNERLKYLLTIGQTGLNVVFDVPTHRGFDADHPLAHGEVGRTGVPCSSLQDMEDLFDGIDLSQVGTSVVESASTIVIMAMFVAMAEKRGYDLKRIMGSIQNDCLKEYINVGSSFLFPPRVALKFATDIFEYCARYMPRWHVAQVNAHCLRENGNDAIQEIAYAFAEAMTFIDSTLARGVDIDSFAGRISFHVSADNHFFEEIAKFRAARRLWARFMKEKYGAKDPKTLHFKCSCQTAGRTLTALEAENNLIRTAYQAMAGVLGGAQSVHCCSLDEPLGLPTDRSARLSLRTQQILAYETGVADTIDPLAGSYMVEAMTNRMEQEILAYLKRIEAAGGVMDAIDSGWFWAETSKVDADRFVDIESGKRVVVGVNKFRMEEDPDVEVMRIDPAYEVAQIRRVQAVRARRDDVAVQAALERLRAEAGSPANLLPTLVEVVKTYATMGEICDVLKAIHGDYVFQASL